MTPRHSSEPQANAVDFLGGAVIAIGFAVAVAGLMHAAQAAIGHTARIIAIALLLTAAGAFIAITVCARYLTAYGDWPERQLRLVASGLALGNTLAALALDLANL